MTNMVHNIFMYLFIFLILCMFRAHRAHHQERQIVSIQPLVAVGGHVMCSLHTTRPPTQSDSYQRLYRVIHKSVKHFKNSQQIDYSTDHGISFADRERNSPSFFTYFTDAQCVHLW